MPVQAEGLGRPLDRLSLSTRPCSRWPAFSQRRPVTKSPLRNETKHPGTKALSSQRLNGAVRSARLLSGRRHPIGAISCQRNGNTNGESVRLVLWRWLVLRNELLHDIFVGDVVFVNYRAAGLSLCFEKNSLAAIHVYNEAQVPRPDQLQFPIPSHVGLLRPVAPSCLPSCVLRASAGHIGRSRTP